MSNPKKKSAEELQADLLTAAKKIQAPCVMCIDFYRCSTLCKQHQAYNELQAALMPLYAHNSQEQFDTTEV